MKSFGILMTLALILGSGPSLRAEEAPLDIIMMEEVTEIQEIPEPVPVELQEPAVPIQIVEPRKLKQQAEFPSQPEVPVTAVEMWDVNSFVEPVQEAPTLPQAKLENFDSVSKDEVLPAAKPLRKKLVKKVPKKKNKIAKKLPRKLPKKKKVPVYVPDEEDNMEYEEQDRDIASDGSRSFTARVSSITEFNGIWEVSFTDEPGRFRIFGSPDSYADYKHSSQFLEVRVDDLNRRIIEVKPIRVRFRPIR